MELGITGHLTRGDEVIKILETLGGVNRYNITGRLNKYFYYIADDKYKDISNSYIGPDEIKGYKIFSLEDFLEKFPYKIGDKVNVWVNHEHFAGPRAELEESEIKSMRWNSGRCEIAYRLKDITGEFYKEDIKGKCNIGKIIEKSEMNMNDNNVDLTLKISTCYVLPDGYHFVDENGNVIDAKKILLVKNSPSYPTTYEECCKVLNYTYEQGITLRGVTEEEEELFRILIVLKRCRDAYWKIAGEQMGLGKPWEPVWDESEDLYTIHTFNGEIKLSGTAHRNAILVFPIEEMREDFYENFKDLIELCKELL